MQVYGFDIFIARTGESFEVCEMLDSFEGFDIVIAIDCLDELRLLARDLSVIVLVEIFTTVSPESLVFYARADIGFIGQWGGD